VDQDLSWLRLEDEMKKKTKFMFRKQYINAIHNIGSKDDEDNHNVSETTFIDDKWATQYCDTFVYNLKVDRFKKAS